MKTKLFRAEAYPSAQEFDKAVEEYANLLLDEGYDVEFNDFGTVHMLPVQTITAGGKGQTVTPISFISTRVIGYPQDIDNDDDIQSNH